MLNSLNTVNTPSRQIDESVPVNQIISSGKDKSIPSKAFSNPVSNPIWLSVSETAKLGGVTTKTIRRAISARILTYKVVKNRYLIDWQTMLNFLFSTKKLKNKLDQKGVGQYIDKWKL